MPASSASRMDELIMLKVAQCSAIEDVDPPAVRPLMRACLVVTALLATLIGFAAQAYAGKFVEFESGGVESKRVRLGAAAGFIRTCLHGFRRWGYVALAVDSFGPRGIETACGNFGDQPFDAFQALAYLKTQPFVRADHVAVLGFSLEGSSVLTVLENGPSARLFQDKFRAGVALYPPCRGASGIMTAPTLVLIGALDDWTPASACEAIAAGRTELGISRSAVDRSLVRLTIYPDAHHGFDLAGLRFTDGINFRGHRLEYNDAVTRDGIRKVRKFFRQTFSHEEDGK